MPAYWLLKSEPEEWSWDDQVKKGVEHWDGVRNPQAQKNMRAMKTGDQCFFYHSGKQKAVVGIVSVCKEIYPDPSDESGKWSMVDVSTVKPLVQPVTLAEMKADPTFVDLVLLRQSRLSVVPLEEKHWVRINELGSEVREVEPKKPRKRAKKEKEVGEGPETMIPDADRAPEELRARVGSEDGKAEVVEKSRTKSKSSGKQPGKRKATGIDEEPTGSEGKNRKQTTSGSKVVKGGGEKLIDVASGATPLRRSGRSKSSRT